MLAILMLFFQHDSDPARVIGYEASDFPAERPLMLVIFTLRWSSPSGAKDEAHQADQASVGGTMEIFGGERAAPEIVVYSTINQHDRQ